MEDYGVVLQNNLVVRSSNFGGLTSLVFTKDGKVSSFNYMNIRYTAIFVFSTNKFIEYAKTDEFNKLVTIEKNKKGASYRGVPLDLWKNTKVPSLDITFKDYDTLSKLNYNEKIYGALRDQTGLCFNYYTWTYTNPYVNPASPELAPGAGASFGCEILEPNTSARIFFDAYKDKKFYDLGVIQKDEKLVGEVAALMKSTSKQMLEAFDGFAVAGINAGEFVFTENTDGNYSRQELIDYKNGLERWIQIYKENSQKLSKLTDPEKLYIMCDILHKYNMLKPLTVPQKISILLTLCEGPLIAWYFKAKTGFQDKETLAVRVIDAVRDDQANDFLDALIVNKLQVVKGTVSNALSPILNPSGGYKYEWMCLYRILFKKIDDYFGQDNFTLFIKKLEELVLKRNGIVDPDATPYTPNELKTLTKAQFIWGAIRNRNKVSYSVGERSNETITFLERICEKFSEVEIQNSTTFGIPSKNSFTTTICTSHIEKPIQVAHFDLVSIHFFENPSFIDLGVDQPYKEKHFLTFAGFIDYLIEKEDTKLIEEVIVVALTAIFMTVGFGEVVAAIRSVQVARALVGISTVVGDTSIYLTQNTAFKNYIITKYPEDHGRIMDVLLLGGSVFSLGGGIVSGSGILKTYSAEDAAQLVGFSRQVLTDVDAVTRLTPNDLTIFRKGLDVFENGLFRVKYDMEFVKDVSRGRAVLKFYDDAALRVKIFSLDEVNKLRFLDNFADISNDFTINLKRNPDFVAHWDTLSDAEKTAVNGDKINYFNNWYKAKVVTLAEELRAGGIWIDARGGMYKLHELETLVEINIKYGASLRPSSITEAGDGIATAGAEINKSFDAMGIPESAFNDIVWTNATKRRMQIKLFKRSIDKHFKKIVEPENGTPPLDKIVLDFKNFDEFDPTLRIQFMNYINDPTYKYNYLINNHFETIN
jgi:hypothetical protein